MAVSESEPSPLTAKNKEAFNFNDYNEAELAEGDFVKNPMKSYEKFDEGGNATEEQAKEKSLQEIPEVKSVHNSDNEDGWGLDDDLDGNLEANFEKKNDLEPKTINMTDHKKSGKNSGGHSPNKHKRRKSKQLEDTYNDFNSTSYFQDTKINGINLSDTRNMRMTASTNFSNTNNYWSVAAGKVPTRSRKIAEGGDIGNSKLLREE